WPGASRTISRGRGRVSSLVMRFAVSLFVIAVGAILTFGVSNSPSGVNIHVIGVVLLLVGLAGLVIGYQLYTTPRRTDIIYRHDGETLIEPNSPPPGDPVEPMT